MNTLERFAPDSPLAQKQIPSTIAWYLADLGESRGKQDLFTRQSPQVLKALREHALIESAVSSNRIEGVEVEQARVGTIVFGTPLLKDREEESVSGYRDALEKIHSSPLELPITIATIQELHSLCSGQIWDAGKFKDKDSDIIEKSPDGRVRVRFKTVPADQATSAMERLVQDWGDCLRERWVHPLIALAAFNLDFLCIHPFRDVNGRVSRLLLLLQSYQLGYEVGRYISLERLIEQNKERYYETLEQSSIGWHQGRHDPWPYVGYLLYVLKNAYAEFEERVGRTVSPKGAKTDLVLDAVARQKGEFRLADIERACPGVGREWIRKILADLRRLGFVVSGGRGTGARWRYVGGEREKSKGTTST